MAIAVTFLLIVKRYNSTDSQSDDAVTYENCNIRDGCGILNPEIEVLDSMSFNPSGYTHMYIPAFGRTYWITEAKFMNRKWFVSGKVDVLITYKNWILNSSHFVLRSSSEFDTKITDDLVYRKCETKMSVSVGNTGLGSPTDVGSGGSFVVGVVGNDSSAGMVTYYVLTPDGMSELRNFMLSMSEDDIYHDWETAGQEEEEPETGTGSGSGSGSAAATVEAESAKITAGAVKALLNPFQYIVSCVWFPFTVPAGGGIASIKFGFWDSQIMGAKLGTNYVHVVTGLILAVPKRDDDATRPGDYVRYSPFTNLTVLCPPFESAQIAPEDAGSAVAIQVFVDVITGVGVLKVHGGGSDIVSGSKVLAQRTAQIGVSMQIAQITTDYIGSFGSTQGLLKGAFSLGSEIGSKIATALGKTPAIEPGILNGAASSVTISGAASGFSGLALAGQAFLILRYTDITEADNDHVGKPLCKIKTLRSLSGYCLCRDGEVSAPATDEELREIENFLTSGFFIV